MCSVYEDLFVFRVCLKSTFPAVTNFADKDKIDFVSETA